MMNHDARAPEKTVFLLPTLVPPQRASRTAPTCVQQPGVPSGTAEEDPSQVARGEPGLRYSPPDPAAERATTTAGATAFTRPVEPTSLGSGERRVRAERR